MIILFNADQNYLSRDVYSIAVVVLSKQHLAMISSEVDVLWAIFDCCVLTGCFVEGRGIVLPVH